MQTFQKPCQTSAQISPAVVAIVGDLKRYLRERGVLQVVPWLIGLTFFVIVIFVIQTGNKNKTWAVAYALWKSILISIGVAIFFFLLTQFVVMPVLTARIDRAYAQMQR